MITKKCNPACLFRILSLLLVLLLIVAAAVPETSFAAVAPDSVTEEVVPTDEEPLIESFESSAITVFAGEECIYFREYNSLIFNQCNAERAKEGLQPFIWDEGLYQGCLIRAKEVMFGSFSHVRPNGGSPWTVLPELGFKPPQAVGENLAIGYDPDEVVEAWMNSPGHRAVIMSKSSKTFACAVAGDSWGPFVYVQLFSTNEEPYIAGSPGESVYFLTIVGGIGATYGMSYLEGKTVNIYAGTPPAGQRFKNWTSSGGGTFGNANSASTTFTMPANAVTVMANFETIPTFKLTINGGTWLTGNGSYSEGTVVNISAGTPPAGQQFKSWTSSGGGTFGNANSTSTTFRMPANAVTITANYEATKYKLVVTGGAGATGSGSYEAGTIVSISAGVPPAGQEFKYWTSNGAVKFGNANSASTTIKMPEYGSTIVAVFGAPTAPAKPAAPKAASSGYSSVKVSWNKVAGASGYEVRRSTAGNGTYTAVKTVSGNATVTFNNTGLTAGKTYYYKVRAYRTVNGTKVYGPYTAVVSAKPIPAKPGAPKAVSSGSKSIKVSWNKVAGASGYEIRRATASNGTYKVVKTVTNVSTLSFKNTGLTSGKTYYYKVRAYRTVNGTKVYGSFSSVTNTKVK